MTMPDLEIHKPIVEAIEYLISQYPEGSVWTKPDGKKGAFVRVDDLELSDFYVQDKTWIGFQITDMFPIADIYPHHLRPDLACRSGAVLTPPFQAGQIFPGTGDQSTMVSRSAGNHQMNSYTGPELAYIKLRKVQSWVNSPR